MTAAMEGNQQEEQEMIKTMEAMSRKEKRKALKKMKRKQVRREIATKQKEEEEARLNDPEEQMRLLRLEQQEAERMARDRLEFEERERLFLQTLELKKKQEQEEEQQRKLEESQSLVKDEDINVVNEDDGWEYVEEGPAEIIWKGNEIIVKKKKVRVPKKGPDVKEKQECERPISNPLAPQSEAYEDYRSAQEVLESVAQEVPNFGTEQDKEHCPFHLKTGVCRFGARCSRVHFYPDKACTLLMKNMYNGPGLAWEQDEGLEFTDEEVERSFEDFYEDVHTEFLKFGEIVNFKVCKNGSSHLRGNVYVHYKSLESAVLAYKTINNRYFAGKVITCEFVNVTRWRVAICGEFMKSRLKTCSRGSACNFIHCFRNPGGDYDWADWDKPAPRYWLKKMAALFGYTSSIFRDDGSPSSYHSRRSMSRGLDSPQRKSFSDEDDGPNRRHLRGRRGGGRDACNLDEETQEVQKSYQDYHCHKHRETQDGSFDGQRSFASMERSSKKRREPESSRQESKRAKLKAIVAKNEYTVGGASDRYRHYRSRSSSRHNRVAESVHDCRNVENFGQGEGHYADEPEDLFHSYKGKHVSQKKKDADSLYSNGESQESEEDGGHHSRSRKNLRKKKNETDLSSISDDSRVEKKRQKNSKESLRLKNKISAAENESDGGMDTHGDRKHRCGVKRSRGKENISKSAVGGVRLGRDEKWFQKKERRSSRLKNHSRFTDTESDREEDRHHRQRKRHSRQMKNDTESSDSTFDEDRLGRKYEEKAQRSIKSSYGSKKEPDLAKTESNKKRIDEKERHHGRSRIAKDLIIEPGLSKVDSSACRCSKDEIRPEEVLKANAKNVGTDGSCKSFHADLDQNHPEKEITDDRYYGSIDHNARFHFIDTSVRGISCRLSDGDKFHDLSNVVLVSERFDKRGDNRRDEEGSAPDKVETCLVHTSCQAQDFDGEAEAELEIACRHAAIKKLEEIRKHKDAQAVHITDPLHSSRMYSHENVVDKGVDVSGVMEKSSSSELATSVASSTRRRI